MTSAVVFPSLHYVWDVAREGPVTPKRAQRAMDQSRRSARSAQRTSLAEAREGREGREGGLYLPAPPGFR